MLSIKKFIASLTAASFLFSFVFADAVHATMPLVQGSRELQRVVSPEPFLPSTVGRITENRIFEASPSVLAVIVQDLHCHPEVQRNIGKIIGKLNEKRELDRVYVEGGYGQIYTSWLGNIDNKDLKKEIAETLIDDGRLTGPEYYSAMNQKTSLLHGMEDKSLHQQNIVRLGLLIGKKDRFEANLAEMDKNLAVMQAKYFSGQNKRFSRIIDAHHSGKLAGDKYFILLSKYAKKINEDPNKYNNLFTIDFNRFPTITAYLQLLSEGKRLDYGVVSRQLQKYVQSLKSVLPFGEYNELLEKTDNFRKTDEMYLLLGNIVRQNRRGTAVRFPELVRFFDYTAKSQSVNPIKLIDEERHLVEEIRIGFSRDYSELEVSFLTDFRGHFGDYLLNRLTADDYQYFKQRFDKFQMLWGKYAFRNHVRDLAGDFDLLNTYYEANCTRNNSFINNIDELRQCSRGSSAPLEALPVQAAGALSGAKSVAVIVTGGFHTEGLKQIFEDRGISYITITPNVTKDTQLSGERYIQFAREQARILSNSLALGLASQMQSIQLFKLATSAAQRELDQVGFSKENIEKLVVELSKATGLQVQSIQYPTEGEAVIILENGTEIELSKSDKGTTSLGMQWRAGNHDVQGSFDDAFNAVLSVARGLEGGDAAVIPVSYPIFRNLVAYAAEHNMVLGDGLIYEAETMLSDNQKLKTIDGIETAVLANMPDFAQHIIIERQRRKLDLADQAQRSEWLRVLIAIDLLREFILSSEKWTGRQEVRINGKVDLRGVELKGWVIIDNKSDKMLDFQDPALRAKLHAVDGAPVALENVAILVAENGNIQIKRNITGPRDLAGKDQVPPISSSIIQWGKDNNIAVRVRGNVIVLTNEKNGKKLTMTDLEHKGVSYLKIGSLTYQVVGGKIDLSALNPLGNSAWLEFTGSDLGGLKDEDLIIVDPISRDTEKSGLRPFPANPILYPRLAGERVSQDVLAKGRQVLASFLTTPQHNLGMSYSEFLNLIMVTGLNPEAKDYYLAVDVLNIMMAEEQFAEHKAATASVLNFLYTTYSGVDWTKWRSLREVIAFQSAGAKENGGRAQTLFERKIEKTRLPVSEDELDNWEVDTVEALTEDDLEYIPTDPNDPVAGMGNAEIEQGQVVNVPFCGGAATTVKKIMGKNKLVHNALKVVVDLPGGKTTTRYISLLQARLGLLLGQNRKAKVAIVTSVGGTQESESDLSTREMLEQAYRREYENGQMHIAIQRNGLLLDPKTGQPLYFKDGRIATCAENHLWAFLAPFLNKDLMLDLLRESDGIFSAGNGDNVLNYARAGMVGKIMEARRQGNPLATVAICTPSAGDKKGGFACKVTYKNKIDGETITRTEFREVGEFPTRDEKATGFKGIDLSKENGSAFFQKCEEKGWFIEDIFGNKKVAFNVAFYAVDGRLMIARMFGLDENDPLLLVKLNAIDPQDWVDRIIEFGNLVPRTVQPSKGVPNEDNTDKVTGYMTEQAVQDLIVNALSLLAREGSIPEVAIQLAKREDIFLPYKGTDQDVLDENGQTVRDTETGAAKKAYDLVANQRLYRGIFQRLRDIGHLCIIGKNMAVREIEPMETLEEIQKACTVVDQTTGLLTLSGTVDTYLSHHPRLQKIYDNTRFTFVKAWIVAWVSIAPGAYGAPRAELDQLAAAIAAHIMFLRRSHEDWDKFIDAHKPADMDAKTWKPQRDVLEIKMKDLFLQVNQVIHGQALNYSIEKAFEASNKAAFGIIKNLLLDEDNKNPEMRAALISLHRRSNARTIIGNIFGFRSLKNGLLTTNESQESLSSIEKEELVRLWQQMKGGKAYTVASAVQELGISENLAQKLLNNLASLDHDMQQNDPLRGVEGIEVNDEMVYQFLTPALISPDIFRDYDYRSPKKGSVDFSPKRIFYMTLAQVAMAQEKAKLTGIPLTRVLVAKDCRLTNPAESDAVLKAIEASGLEAQPVFVETLDGDSSNDYFNSAASYAWSTRIFTPQLSIFLTASHVAAENTRGEKVSMLTNHGSKDHSMLELTSMTKGEIKESRDVLAGILSGIADGGLSDNNPIKGQTFKKRSAPVNVGETHARMVKLLGLVSDGQIDGLNIRTVSEELRKAEVKGEIAEYVERMLAKADPNRPLPLAGKKIVVEGSHTPSGMLAANAFKALGAEVIPLNLDVQRLFGKHKADPSIMDNLKDLKAKMKATGADFGMAFDLDGDRGAIVVPVPEQIDESGFTVLSPDAITQALIPFYAKRGYTTKEAGKIAIVTDRLSSKAVVDMGKRYGIEVYRVNAGYPNLKAKTRELKAQGYTVVSLAEKSGHTWTDGTGLFEDPIVVGAYFAQMVKESNTKSSRFPFYDAFTANTIPYKVSTRFQPVFHDAYKEKLIREYAQNRREGDPEKLEGVALVAAGLDQAITTLSKHFKPGTEFKTPAGTLVVKSFEIDYDLVVKTKQVCADISFTLNGKDAGTFIFRASSNDPSWVFAYETPIYGNETQESESMKLRFTSVGGVVLEYLENAELATVMGVSYTNSEEAQAVLQAYRDGRAFGSTTEKGAAATPDETQDMTSAETRQLTDQKAPEKFKRSEQGSASMKFIVAAAGVLGAIALVPLVIANPAIAAAIAAALAVTGGAVVLAMYAWKAKKEGTTLLNVLDIHLISGPRALKSAVREFGAASKDDQGNVRTEIFTGKLLPEDAAELELKNLGIKVNGKTVWVSAKAGALFVCTDGANDEAVVQALNEMLSGKGKMRGNGRFLKRLAAIAKDAKIDLKDRGFVPGIIIDHMAKGNEISYNKDGSMVVSAGWFRDAKNNSKIDPIQTGRMLGALMTVRNAESVAMSQNILTAVTNEADLVENLEIFSRAGNGQIMVDAAVFTRMSDEKIMQLAELARRSGVRLYADVMTNTELGRKLTGLGLSGYMAGESNKDRRVYDTVISPSGTRASVIIGGEQMTNEQFRDSILRAETPMKVIYLSELKKRLMEGRDIVDRVDLSDLLNTAALRLYQANNITPEFVMNAAYGWSKDALPSLPQDVLGLVKAVSSGKISEVLALLGGENTAVKIYIDKLASRTNGEALQRSFLRGITENMLAQAKLKEVGKEQGLVDRDLETLLGQKLFDRFAQMEKSAAGTDTFKDEGAESFMKTYGQRTASQFFGVLVTEVMRLSSKEFTFDELQQSDPEAKAINTIIELITQLGEPKVLKGTEKAPQIFDAHSVNSVLAAA